MSKQRVHVFVVTVPAVEEKAVMREYVRVAVSRWGHGGDPDSKLFFSDEDLRSIKVTAGFTVLKEVKLKVEVRK